MCEYGRRWERDENGSGFRTQRSVRRTWWTLAVADRGDGHGLLLSPTILPFCLLYLCDMSSPSEEHRSNFQDCAFPPPLPAFGLRAHLSWREQKFLTASLPMLTARRAFCCWGSFFCAPAVRLFDKDFHPATSSGEVSVLAEQKRKELFSRLHPFPSPGIMTTWRRRKKFVFLVFALCVLGWSLASEKADHTSPTAQEGKKAVF